jgi:hypothetical protein
MIVSILHLVLDDVVCCHTSVGFLLFYLIWWAMRRPLLVNNQRRSALFLYTYTICMVYACVICAHACVVYVRVRKTR